LDKLLTPRNPILLVDDEPSWLRGFSLALERRAGLSHFLICSDSREVLEVVGRQPLSLVALDLTMPHISGEQLLEQIVRDYPDLPVIILTGVDQAETAVRCMKKGAFDYFVKTAEEDRLVSGIQRALRMQELIGENRQLRDKILREELQHHEIFEEIITRDAKMFSLFKYLEAVAPGSEPILITGECGTGKELIARAAHRLGRPKGPFVPVNVAGLDDLMFADTLFGHVRGAFTGADRLRPGLVEQAAGGTLFLDEIGDLSQASQVKLLRLLQEGEYLPLGSDRPKRAGIRVVAATNQDLTSLQAEGRFRRDFFYRLCGHQVQLPPLKERPGDLPLLLGHFLREAAESLGKPVPTYPPELITLLATYPFPGNVRELRAMAFEAVSLHSGRVLSMAAFEKAMGLDRKRPSLRTSPAQPIIFPELLPTIEEAVESLVEEAMRRSKGNQTLAARYLGISRPALSKRLKKKQDEGA
jgi:DNA-binding NtrC family response regulator